MAMKVGGGGGFLPASHPCKEGGIVLGGQHVGPEVGTSGGRYCGDDFGHAGTHDECYRWLVEVEA